MASVSEDGTVIGVSAGITYVTGSVGASVVRNEPRRHGCSAIDRYPWLVVGPRMVSRRYQTRIRSER
ncbi:MAG: hypothetical protein KFH98_13885 [Gemmatimonadetes bacterium]|nr:hypothetical protein [Gemmatimonadota bacterium]